MSELIDEYRAKENIDVNNLSEELAQQPVTFDAVADQYALAVANRDEAENEVKRVYAALSKEIRMQYEKLSDAKVDSEILVRVEYVDALKNAVSAKYEANRWFGVKESFHQRASMLTKLVDLQLKGTFSNIPLRAQNNADYVEAKNAAMEARRNRNQE